MRPKKWQCKLLSGILCASLVFQSLSVTTYASETDTATQITVEQTQEDATVVEERDDTVETKQVTEVQNEETVEEEENVAETEAESSSEEVATDEQPQITPETTEAATKEETTETVTTEEKTTEVETSEEATTEMATTEEAGTEETTEEVFTEEVATEEMLYAASEIGSFENIEIEYAGFEGYITGGKLTLNEIEDANYIYLRAVQYDKNDNKLSSYRLTTFYDTTAQEYDFSSHSYSFTVHDEASYVRLEVYVDSETEARLVSDNITIGQRPDVTFKVADTEVGSGSVVLTISYDGDLCLNNNRWAYVNFRFSYGTSKDESTWSSNGTSLSYSPTYTTTREMRITGLTPGQTYYGKLTVYRDFYNDLDNNDCRVFEQVITLDSFTMKEGNTYNLKTVFPDAVLREQVIMRMNDSTLTEDSDVSSADLEKITYLSTSSRTDPNSNAVKDLTGIDLLTGLTSLYMDNQEIDDISGIDWSKLTRLETINLAGNNIASIPDFSKNTKLRYIYLNENMLSDAVLTNVYSKLASGTSLYSDNQRTEGLKLDIDDNYYVYANGSAVYVKLTGYKTAFSYAVKFYLDGEEKTFSEKDSYYHIYSLEDADLTTGKHTIKAELLWDGSVVSKTKDYTFNIVDEKLFAGKQPYYFDGSGNDNYLYMQVYTTSDKAVERMTMVNDAGKVYAQTEYAVNPCTAMYYDPRLTVYSSIPGGSLYYVGEPLGFRYNTTPAGSYDLKLEYADGTSDILEDVIRIAGSEEVAITSCSIGYDYDNTGDYIYLSLSGSNIDPSKLDYTFSYNGNTYPVTYVNYKEVYSGLIVKLKKNNWTTLRSNSLNVKITGKSGYTVISGDVFTSVYISDGIYYSAYNEVTGQLEVAFSTSLEGNNQPVTVSVREGWDKDTYPEIANGSATIVDGLAYFDLKNSDGTAYVLTKSGEFYFTCTLNGEEYIDSIRIYDPNRNYWSSSSSIIIEGTKAISNWFYSEIPYSEANADRNLYEAEITADNLATPIKAQNIWTFESNGCVGIEMNFATDDLKAGTYTVILYKDEEALSSTTFKVMAAEKFILNYVSASWETKSEISFYIKTPNITDADNYEITFTDVDGNTVSGLTIKETRRYYDGYIYFSITGLNYENAARYYYIKVNHKTLGAPYTTEEQLYYSNEKGALQNIYCSSAGYTTSGKRMVGVYLPRAEFPVTIKVYKPYDTNVLQEITLSSKASLTDKNFYYFTKSFYDSLPNKDSVYDVIIIENDKKITASTKVLGYLASTAQEKIWSYTVDRTSLFLNTEDENTATITVSDYTKSPTFKSSDTSVAKVAVDKDNASKAVITAVGLGVATISISADGTTRTFTVTVDRKVSVDELILNKTELTLGVGNSCELTATVRPMEAWTEENTITFTSSDETVVAVTDGICEESATITALKVGTATITAMLDGTDFAATCKVTVTDVHTTEQQDSLVQAVGTKYVLLNAYKNNTATLADVTLPDGWSWEDDSVKLVADDVAPIQKYMARFEKDGFETFTALLPVAVSKLTGISVTGGEKILTGTDATSEIVLKYKGYQPVADEYSEYLTYSWTAIGKAPIVEVITPSARKTVITAQESITKNTIQSVNVTVAVNKNAKQTYKATLKITVIPEPYVDRIAIDYAADQLPTEVTSVFDNNVLEIDSAAISTVKDAVTNTVRMEAHPLCGSADPVIPTGLKWTSSDSSVVTVKAEKDSTFAVLTVKKAGSAVIKITATDGGKYEQEFEVKVFDYSPIMDNKNITVNLYNTEGTVIPVKPQNGNTITDIKILEGTTVSDKFTVTKNGEVFVINTAESFTTTRNVKVKATLQIETKNGTYADNKTQAVIITVDVKKPTASVKVKTKANLFYTDATATYTVTSKYEIANIVDVTGGNDPRFHATYDAEQGIISFSTNGSLTKDTLAQFKNKNSSARNIALKVSFAGYSEAASQIINVNVTTEEKKLSLKMDDLMLMPGIESGVVEVIDSKTKNVWPLSDAETFKITSDNSRTNDVTAVKSADKVKVTYDGSKNVTYKAEITSTNWTSALSVNGKITVAGNQNLVLDNAKVTLNTAYNIQENGKLAIDVSVKNHDGDIQSISYQIDKKNAPLFNNGYLSITYSADKQQIYVGLNKGNRGTINAGNYKINLYGTVLVGNQEVEIKPATLTVALVAKVPTVSMKAKGSIDLVRRDTTSIVYTPKLGNVTAVVESVKLTGSYSGYFTASVENGNVVLQATDQSMSTKITYPVKMILTLNNGSEVTTTVKVKPVNKTPKLVASLTNKTLYKTSPGVVSFKVTSNSADTKIDSIIRVEDKNSKYFNFVYDNTTGTVSVSLTDEASKLKPGKYTISYQVKMEGAAYNVKPTTMKLTITVK